MKPLVRSGAEDGAFFRSVMGSFATGVVALTGISEGAPTGLVVNSFTSVSLDPPLALFCVAHTSTSWPPLRAAGSVCVNVLAADQLQVSRRLARRGGDKFQDLGWSRSPGGLPILDGAIAWMECSVISERPAGDHDIVVARVVRLAVEMDSDPLLFFRGDYGSFVRAELSRNDTADQGSLHPYEDGHKHRLDARPAPQPPEPHARHPWNGPAPSRYGRLDRNRNGPEFPCCDKDSNPPARRGSVFNGRRHTAA